MKTPAVRAWPDYERIMALGAHEAEREGRLTVAARRAVGLSQTAWGRAHGGLARQTVSDIENGHVSRRDQLTLGFARLIAIEERTRTS